MRRLCPPSAVRAAVALVLVVGLAPACGSKRAQLPGASGQPDKFLFDRGTEALAKKRWLRAREYFRQLVDNYPQSQYRPDAKLGLGDTYLGENTTESVILSVNEFREFLTFYPTSPRAYYAQFKLGMAHFAQMLSPQRDQTQTREAIKEFEVFLDRYGSSPLAAEGRQKLRECRDRLSQSEHEVGLYYWRSKWFPGAIERFKAVLKDDPEYTNRDAVYYYLADSLAKITLTAEALPYLDRLTREFEKSEYLARATKLMEELKNPPAPTDKAGQKKDKPEPAPGEGPDKKEAAKKQPGK